LIPAVFMWRNIKFAWSSAFLEEECWKRWHL